MVTIRQVAFHIVLIEFHQTSDVVVLVLGVDNFLDILLEFQDNCLLVIGLQHLIGDLDTDLRNFALHLSETRSMVLESPTLILKIFFELEQLILQVVDLFLLRLQ